MLCDLKSYRRITGDKDSYDGDVLAALVEAQGIVEDRTGRYFDQVERTETLKVFQNGRVYPHAYPVISVSVPVGASILGNSVRFSSWNSWDPIVNHNPDIWFIDPAYRPTATITYVGGFESGTGPIELVRATAEIANLSLNPSKFKVPAGTTGVTVGEVSFQSSNGFGGVSALPANILRTLNRFKYREAF